MGDRQDAAQAQCDENSSSRMAVTWLCIFGVQNNVCSRYKDCDKVERGKDLATYKDQPN
jgi:hypothetical protein